MAKTRILFVDDEEGIRITLPMILEMHGFQVRTASNVPEALALINTEHFDVLLSDLNIGEPGDGFTVVSAMRRTQPQAVTLIITGYPAFETALQAIRAQVDDYVVKPTRADQLVQLIESKLQSRTPHRQAPFRRVASIIFEGKDWAINDWLEQVNADPELSRFPLTEAERIDHLPVVIAELVDRLNTQRTGLSSSVREAAAEHARHRLQQGYTLTHVLRETRLLRASLGSLIQRHLLGIDISWLVNDLIELNACLDEMLEQTMEVFSTLQAPLQRR